MNALVKELQKILRGKEQLEREREQIAERLTLRERLKDLFKKHGFTIATVVTAVGITIGVVAKILADGAIAAANGMKTVGKKVGDGLKEPPPPPRPRPAGGRDRQLCVSRGGSGYLISCQKRLAAYSCCGGLHDPKTHREEARISSHYFLAQKTKPTKTSAPRPTSALFM